MKNKEMSKAVILIIVSCLCLILAPSAFAHKLWINTTDYYPELFSHPKYAPVPQAKIMVYFGWGHKLPVSDAFSADYFMRKAPLCLDLDIQRAMIVHINPVTNR